MKRKLMAGGRTGHACYGEEKAFHITWMMYALMVCVGVLVPHAKVYGGLAPFGVSVAACTQGIASLFVSTGAAIGYLMASPSVTPLRYIGALICVVGFQWAFFTSERIQKSPVYSPVLAAATTLFSGMALNSVSGFQWGTFVAELCESILAGGFAYFFKCTLDVLQNRIGSRSLDMHSQASVTIVVAVILMALNSMMIQSISIGRILTMLVILLAAKSGQQQGGTLAGVVMGAATTLCTPGYAHLAAAYAFGGLLSGMFARVGKLACTLAFLLVNVLAAFSAGSADTAIIGGYEVFTAALCFVVLPSSVERVMNMIFTRAQSVPAAEGICRSVDMRLTYAADTMSDIAKTVDTVSEKLTAMNTPDMKEVYTDVSERLCNTCSRRELCWKQEFTETMSAFRAMGETLTKEGMVRRETVDEEFRGRCRHLQDVLSMMNHGYSRFILKENAFRRLSDIRSIVTDQFNGMASLLSELSEDFRTPDRSDHEMANRIEQLCERYHVPIIQCVCLIGHRERLTVEILIEGEHHFDVNSRWFADLCNACGCELAAPQEMKSGQYTKVRLSEKPKYQVRFGSAQLNCGKEKLCGDAFEKFYDHDGRCCLVLSDGMGTGGRAAVDGAMTSALAGRMMQAGFSFNSILRVINSALIVKSGDESLSTLDAVCVDLHTGYIHGLKAGAAASYICSGGQIVQISSSSLPIGILKEIDAQEYEHVLSFGDVLVMVSDGVVSEDSEWLEELISRLADEEVDENVIASEIVFRARERQEDGRTDDTTALVLRIA